MAKSSTCNISIRMDSELKAAAEELYEELGMNLSTACLGTPVRCKNPHILPYRSKRTWNSI